MTYTTKGKIFQIGNVAKINANFKKREVIITRDNGGDSAYPNMMLELLNADVAKTDDFKVGDHVSISFAIHGRKYDPPNGGGTKYFNNLRILNIEPIPNDAEDLTTDPVPSGPVTSFDDLPF